MTDRVRRQRRPHRGRPAPPPPASVLELTGHAVDPVERPRPVWAWSETISPATASEVEVAGAPRSLGVTRADEPQPVRSDSAPGWAWKGNGTVVMPAVVFAEPLVMISVPHLVARPVEKQIASAKRAPPASAGEGGREPASGAPAHDV